MSRPRTFLAFAFFCTLVGLVGCKDAGVNPSPSGSIEGTVYDFETKSPLGGVSITTSPATTAIVTDENGHFQLDDVPEESYIITAKRKSYSATSVTVAVRGNKTVQATLFLEAEPTGTVEGKVLDAETKAPVEGVRLTTEPPSNVVDTDASGNFSLSAIGTGDYTLVASRPGYVTDSVKVTVREDRAVQATIHIQKLASAPTGAISGQVFNAESSEPIGGVSVSTSPPSGAVVSDADGRFTISTVAAGDYTIIAKKAGFVTDSVAVSVAADRTVEPTVFMTPIGSPARGSIAGQILDAHTNQPIDGASITTDPPSSAVVSDAGGAFEITSIPAGAYTILARKSGYVTDSVTVSVAAGQRVQPTIFLRPSATPPETGTISGQVLNADTNRPVGGVSITTDPPSGAVVSDGDGRFTIGNIPAGAYTILARKSGYLTDSVAVAVAAGQNVEPVVFLRPVEAPATGRIEGQVFDAGTNQGLGGVSISTSPPSSAVASDGNGRFTISNIATGDYMIIARRAGYVADSVGVSVQAGEVERPAIYLEKESGPAILSIEITGWSNRVSSDSAFVWVQYRVKNVGAADIADYEVYFRITAGSQQIYHEVEGGGLAVGQADVGSFEEYTRSSTTASKVEVSDVWYVEEGGSMQQLSSSQLALINRGLPGALSR